MTRLMAMVAEESRERVGGGQLCFGALGINVISLGHLSACEWTPAATLYAQMRRSQKSSGGRRGVLGVDNQRVNASQ